MKKICCLLALTILAGRPAFADDTPAAPSEKHNIVLGQAEKKTAQDAADKKARDAQALFEESLRQMMTYCEDREHCLKHLMLEALGQTAGKKCRFCTNCQAGRR